MSQVTRNLKEVITVWPYTGSDGYGGYTFGTPRVINGRWEDKQVLFTLPSGREVVSQAVVYVDEDIQTDDYLCRGDQTSESSPINVDGAHKVLSFGRVTSLRNLQTIRKVML